MMSSDSAISYFRRGLTLGSAMKALLLAAAIASLLLRPLMPAHVDTAVVLAVIGVVWIALSYRSIKGSRVAADSPSLIASGQFEQAEARIDEALRSFSLFRTVKLASLHHLAVLRHAQRRWGDTIALCRALLHQRLGTLQSLSKPTYLMLADALLELGDTNGARQAIAALGQYRLSLNEAMTLLLIQLDCQQRSGAWTEMMSGVEAKVQLAELMPSAGAARAQAFLALAAKRTGKIEWMQWLRNRAALLDDAARMCSARPALRELWGELRENQPSSPPAHPTPAADGVDGEK
jgi:hypothetical protein